MAAPSRFVVLFHQMPPGGERGDHWDLMFEDGGTLRTWALDAAPEIGAGCWAAQLADHRLDYLDYEGPVSRGRGEVRGWDRGDYELVVRGDQVWRARLRGRRLIGEVLLKRQDDHRWSVSFAASSGAPGGEEAGGDWGD